MHVHVLGHVPLLGSLLAAFRSVAMGERASLSSKILRSLVLTVCVERYGMSVSPTKSDR